MTTAEPTAAERRARDALVTGEAVVLDLRPASFATRILSFAIDGLVQLGLLTGLLVGAAWAARGLHIDDGFVAAIVLLASVSAFVLYPVLSELLLGGRSLGRLVTGTRVVRDDGGPVHVRQSVLRAVMAMFEIWGTSGGIALVSSLVDHRSRRLGDLLAGTFVVQERMRTRAPERAVAPAELADWSRAADVSGLDPIVLRDVRRFLPRAASLHPTSRRELALDLVQRIVPGVAPPPPPGTDPELFLRAVLAERSRRDEERLRAGLRREEQLTAQVRVLPFTS